MDRLSISDIMWNLNSGFREISFKDAELLLIKREQQLKSEKFKMEEKYNGVLKDNEALKKKCENLWKENKEEVHLRRELREKLHAKESEVKRARKRIRVLETENATERRRAKDSERREKEAIEENTRLLAKIKGLEKEKAEAQRQERDVRGEIEMHLQKIECLEKEKEEALSGAENFKNIFGRFKGRIDSLLEDSSLNAYDRVASNASWHFEADMLSAIDKNPVLAMEAVCSLYRQHISHGNLSSDSTFLENRGFDSLYVFRGTTLAEFLLNGDPQGDMKSH